MCRFFVRELHPGFGLRFGLVVGFGNSGSAGVFCFVGCDVGVVLV